MNQGPAVKGGRRRVSTEQKVASFWQRISLMASVAGDAAMVLAAADVADCLPS